MNCSRTVILLFVAAAGLLGGSCSREARVRRLLSTADAHFAAGRYEPAEIAYKNVLQRQPLDPDAIGHLGRIYQAQGRTAPALAYLTKAKELRPNDGTTRVTLALALFAAGAAQQAHAEAAFVLKQNPADPDAPLLLVESSRSAAELAATRATLEALPPKPPVLVALGQIRLRTGATEQGQRLFEQAAAADPKSAAARAALGMLAWAKKDLTRANENLKQAAGLAPPRSPFRLQYARFKLQTGDLAAGKQALEQLTKQTPDYIPAWLARIEVAAAEKDYAGAEPMLRDALGHDPTNPELLLLGGRLQLAQGNVDKAVAELERMNALYPRSPAGLYMLGNAYTAKGDLSKAADTMTLALGVVPGYSPAALALAELNVRRGNYDAAVTALKPIVAAQPQLVPVQLLLAQAYRGQGDWAAALAVYQRLEKDAGGNPQIPYLRGLVLREQGQTAAARAAFETAAVLNPTSLEPLTRLVELDVAEKQYERAVARVHTALPKLPKTADPYVLLGSIHLATQDLAAAQNDFELATKTQPDAPTAYLMLGRIYVARNQHAKAIDQLQIATTRNPKNVEALTTLAVLFEVTKQDARAVEAYDKLLAVDPKSVTALNNLAGLLAKDPRQLDRANTLAERARNLAPNDPAVSDTLGWILYLRGAYPQALALLRDAAVRLPEEPAVQFHLGMCHYTDGDEPLAKAALEIAAKASIPAAESQFAQRKLAVLAIVPGAVHSEDRALLEAEVAQTPIDPAAAVRLAALYQYEGFADKARALIDKASKATPKNPRVLLASARLASEAGDKSSALETARAAHALAPGDSEITAVLGQLAYDTGHHLWAAALLEEAASQMNSDPGVLYAWANAAYAVGRVADAEHAARQALEAKPASPRREEVTAFLDLLAIAAKPDPARAGYVADVLRNNAAYAPALMAQAALQQNQNDIRAARQTYEAITNNLPNFTPAYRSLALLFASQLDGSATAAATANKARQAYPNDPVVAKAAGIISYQQRDFARAATLLTESTAAEPNDSAAVFYLGMAQFQLKRAGQAKQTLQRALELGLANDLAQQARRIVAVPN